MLLFFKSPINLWILGVKIQMQQAVYDCKWVGGKEGLRFPLPQDIWNLAEEAGLTNTADGSNPRLNTKVRALWNDWGMYVRFDCEDDYILATYENRDDPIYNEDAVEIFISCNSQLEHYYEFEFSPKQVLFDAIIANDLKGTIQVDTSWDCKGLDCLVDNRLSEGRVVYEIAIPFSALKDEENGGQQGKEWLINFYRIDRSPEKGDEFSAWSPTMLLNYHVPDRFGRIVFQGRT
jgi:hypothetical protein